MVQGPFEVLDVSKKSKPEEQFISESITPEVGNFSTELMGQGLAALPGAFVWRDRRYEIVECLEHIKQTSTEGNSAAGDRYLRRQQFRVTLDSGQQAVIYFERQARSGKSRAASKKRWYLYSLTSE